MARDKIQQAEQRQKDLELLIRHGFSFQTGGEIQGRDWELTFQVYERRTEDGFYEVTLYSDLNHEVEFIDIKNRTEHACTWPVFLKDHLGKIPVIVKEVSNVVSHSKLH